MLAAVPVSELTDDDRGRLAYLRALNTLWALGDARRAKEIIDDAAGSAVPRFWIDAVLAVYWFTLDQPQEALQASESLVLEDLPAVAGAETAWVLAAMLADEYATVKDAVNRRVSLDQATATLTFPQYRDWRNYARLQGEIKALYELIATGKRSYLE